MLSKKNVLITVTNNPTHEGLLRLMECANRFGWTMVVLTTEWRGFGTKLITTYEYLRDNPEVESFVFADAHDVVILSTPEEFSTKIGPYEDKMIVSCEKACWPDSSLASDYKEVDSEWKYINSGLYYSTRDVFMSVFESSPPEYYFDDQLWLAKRYLEDKFNRILLDNDCLVFQSYSHIADDDYDYKNGRLLNLKTKSEPIFVHGNGRTDLTKVLELLKL